MTAGRPTKDLFGRREQRIPNNVCVDFCVHWVEHASRLGVCPLRLGQHRHARGAHFPPTLTSSEEGDPGRGGRQGTKPHAWQLEGPA
eukprot:664963-Prorocentrum_minimum.AAC.1